MAPVFPDVAVDLALLNSLASLPVHPSATFPQVFHVNAALEIVIAIVAVIADKDVLKNRGRLLMNVEDKAWSNPRPKQRRRAKRGL